MSCDEQPVEVRRCPPPDDGVLKFALPRHIRLVVRPDCKRIYCCTIVSCIQIAHLAAHLQRSTHTQYAHVGSIVISPDILKIFLPTASLCHVAVTAPKRHCVDILSNGIIECVQSMFCTATLRIWGRKGPQLDR